MLREIPLHRAALLQESEEPTLEFIASGYKHHASQLMELSSGFGGPQRYRYFSSDAEENDKCVACE